MKPRKLPAQRAGLTRAVKSGDPLRIRRECERVVRVDWPALGYWPDCWSDWQRALDDARPVHAPRLEDLAR